MCVLQRVFSVDSRSQGHSSPVRFCWQKAHGNYLATSGYSLQLLSNPSKHIQCTYRNMSGRRTFFIILLQLNSHGYDVSLKQFADTDHGKDYRIGTLRYNWHASQAFSTSTVLIRKIYRPWARLIKNLTMNLGKNLWKSLIHKKNLRRACSLQRILGKLTTNLRKTYDSNLAVVNQSYVVFIDELQFLSA